MHASSQIPPPSSAVLRPLADRGVSSAEIRAVAQTLEWFRDRWAGVAALTAGRPDHYHVSVGAIRRAADCAAPAGVLTVALDGTPVLAPADTDPDRIAVRLRSPFGSPAELLLSTEDRMALVRYLLASPGERPCPTRRCGMDSDLDPSDPGACGWIAVQVAGTEDDRPRWYCTAWCAEAAITAAAAELAAADTTGTAPPEPPPASPTDTPRSPLATPPRSLLLQDDDDLTGGAW
ncbi:hypothetical protein ACFV0R_15650 [Streptomyces sp. NPDC059578]|uniref:hypothetical protein n=1 Tax=Streptomyces sp. NPDC059578 TaxID=3346874 RepID=UPI0036803B92